MDSWVPVLRLAARTVLEAVDLPSLSLRPERAGHALTALRLARDALEAGECSGLDENFLASSALLLEALRREGAQASEELAALAVTCSGLHLKSAGESGPKDLGPETTRSLAILVAALLFFAGHHSRALAEAACDCVLDAIAALPSAAAWRAFFPGLFSRLQPLCCRGKSRRVAARALACVLEGLCVFSADDLPENKAVVAAEDSRPGRPSMRPETGRPEEELSAPSEGLAGGHQELVSRLAKHLPGAARSVLLTSTPAESSRLVSALRRLLTQCGLFLGEELCTELLLVLVIPFEETSPEVRSFVLGVVDEVKNQDTPRWSRLRGRLFERAAGLLTLICGSLVTMSDDEACAALSEAMGLFAVIGEEGHILIGALSADTRKLLRQLTRLCEVNFKLDIIP